MVDLLAAGAQDFLGGQDASKIPDRIPDNCYYSGVNVSVRRGSLQPRWGFERVAITYPAGTVLDPYRKRRTYQNIFESSKFQAMAPYYVGNTQYIIFVLAGQIFALNPNDYTLIPITIADGSMLNTRATRINWSAAGKYLVLYDFPAFPVILDGFSARRADQSKMEIPAASQGAFNQNRLFVANNGYEFTGGDPVGSPAAPDAPITFQEVFTIGSPYFGQIFSLPTSDHNDPITYMGFLQVTDTSTGIGPLIIGTNRALYSFGTQNPRTAWESGPFGSIICYNAGIVGPRAFANVNSDAFFLSGDGYVRSLSMSRAEQQRWARVPISREVENWFKFWDRSLIRLGFVSYFKNKIFFSVNPYRTSAIDYTTLYPISDYAHGGMVVMELDSLTSFGETTKPVWTGLWTGVRPMDMVNIEDRAFVISKDSSNINRVYEVNPNITYDTADDKIRPVRSRVYTKEYDFQDPFMNKELHSLDVNFDALQGDFKFKVEYKASHSACFVPWKSFTHYAPWRTCEMPDGCFLNGFAPHYIRDFTMEAPSDNVCNIITKDFLRVFRKVQLAITVEGKYWEIHEVRIKAVPRPQLNIQSICETYPKTAICDCCTDDWAIGSFESCEKLQT